MMYLIPFSFLNYLNDPLCSGMTSNPLLAFSGRARFAALIKGRGNVEIPPPDLLPPPLPQLPLCFCELGTKADFNRGRRGGGVDGWRVSAGSECLNDG